MPECLGEMGSVGLEIRGNCHGGKARNRMLSAFRFDARRRFIAWKNYVERKTGLNESKSEHEKWSELQSCRQKTDTIRERKVTNIGLWGQQGKNRFCEKTDGARKVTGCANNLSEGKTYGRRSCRIKCDWISGKGGRCGPKNKAAVKYYRIGAKILRKTYLERTRPGKMYSWQKKNFWRWILIKKPKNFQKNQTEVVMWPPSFK